MITLKNVEFYYRKKNSLFQNFNIELKQGNIYGLLGKNGAGKTTLLKMIAGLHFAKNGEIEIVGQLVKKRSVALLSEIFFMPEELFAPALKIETFCKIYSPFYPGFDFAHFMFYLKEFELDEKANINELSYGQKKKMHIAFGLATNAKVLLFDEPTNGLDIPSKSAFRKIISEAALDERLVIISTHQIRDVEKLIDPLIIIDDGEIILNSDTYSISEKISIEMKESQPSDGEYFHYQKTPQGYACIGENRNHNYNEIDLEILFNAILANEKIREVLK